ncbi:MAG: restriction endonuclease subunit S [Gemmatimonadetes bacterium]|nr:restriction endonuclease subunit S [Gemmatimonadota bacterium]
MRVDLKPYPEMRDSGVELLGKVPEHWEVRSLGTFGRFYKGSGGTKADETEQGVPCVRYGDLYTRHRFHITATRACVAPDRAGAYTPVRYGDVLFAGSGETLEEIGKSAVDLIRGSVVCGGDVIVFRPTIDVDAEFIGWSADCRQAASQKARMGRGITVMHIYSSHLKYLLVPLPPLTEQTAIARFLDDADRRIRRHIRAKERLIELLEEERQATIHEAVTGCIDVRTGRPYPSYKDSGFEWLGEVPDHWEVRSLGTFGRLFKGSGGTKADETELGVPCVRYGDLYTRHQFHITKSKACVAPDRARAYTPVRYGDVLFAGSGETLDEIGKSAVNLIRESAVCGGDVIVFRPTIHVDAEFIGWSTDCRHAASQKARMGRGITVMHIYSSDLKHLALPLPPLTEQTAIARFLAAVGRRMSARSAAVERELDLLREYRTRLVSDVVTGKLDVRAVAAGLLDHRSDSQPGAIDS